MYHHSQIWNIDKSGAQAGQNGNVIVLVRREVQHVHTITYDDREHLSMLSCIIWGLSDVVLALAPN